MSIWQRNEHPALTAEQARTAALLRLRDEWIHFIAYKRLQFELRKEQDREATPESTTADQPDELQPGAAQ